MKTHILNFMKENNLTKTEFCNQCGISMSTLNRIFKGYQADTKTLIKFVKILNIPFEELFYSQKDVATAVL